MMKISWELVFYFSLSNHIGQTVDAGFLDHFFVVVAVKLFSRLMLNLEFKICLDSFIQFSIILGSISIVAHLFAGRS